MATVASLVLQVTVGSVTLSGATVAVSLNSSPSSTSFSVASRVTVSASTGLTVTAQVALASPQAAVMVALPTAMAFTLPSASTVATVASLVLQVTVGSVTFSGATVAVSLNSAPTSTSFSVMSSVTVSATIGLTAISMVPLTAPQVAVMVAVPTLTPVTTPCSSTVAVSASLVLQVTVLSNALSGATVAVSCRVLPSSTSALSSGADTVTVSACTYSVAWMRLSVAEPPVYWLPMLYSRWKANTPAPAGTV